jgi:hypothetical protein
VLNLKESIGKNTVYGCPIYGAEVTGSIADKDVEVSVQLQYLLISISN